ncbi:hypothetical protein D187_004951 [Cystobacter fuscus DSM 2262]|uniref:SnoaL-like domain-containing protein n=1 Tax=Cystobacter fuscus (strain ATCC 25194 / DSM 2262 / NBRC 100088 / M29) TaxID=1242864 RepID=S9PMW6_CYSF2|nr:nuclear transport factor 2 family protein [Cystobacter fuscus]EPX63822.1 hypothetical protein D187_004951 [Cystobacter fuscus DSM 2262]
MTALSLLCLTLLSAPPNTGAKPSAARPAEVSATATVNAVLDDWHRAAAQADEARYFAHFTPDAIYLGTDATERWTRDEFRAWAHPYFAKGKAWNFTPSSRHVSLSKDGSMAWFDEVLATPNLGPSRGSGVLVKEGGTWKIAQYNLSVPIPNDVLDDVKARIEAYEKTKAKPGK